MGWVEDFAIGLVVGGASAYGIRWVIHYARSHRETDIDLASLPPSVLGDASPQVLPGATADAAGNPPPRPEGIWPGIPPPTGVPRAGSGGVGPLPGAPAKPPAELVRLSTRIVLHLSRLGHLGPDDVGLPGSTQRGIGEALAAEQSAVSKVLRRLVAAEVVEVGRRHVQGQGRRVNVYTLTRRGQVLARELRGRTSVGTDGADRPWTDAGRTPTTEPVPGLARH
jgi:DNA-binding MarR family transcriptional regulator